VPGPPPELRWGRGLNNRLSGTWGEELALRYLRRRGYTLVERNYRTRYGEVDLIVRHHDTLVFVEVKTRRGVGFGDPLEAVTPRKPATIRALAERYLSEREPDLDEVRFDVVGILAGDGAPRVTHIENAF
jgi:putative endonuclease